MPLPSLFFSRDWKLYFGASRIFRHFPRCSARASHRTLKDNATKLHGRTEFTSESKRISITHVSFLPSFQFQGVKYNRKRGDIFPERPTQMLCVDLPLPPQCRRKRVYVPDIESMSDFFMNYSRIAEMTKRKKGKGREEIPVTLLTASPSTYV